MNEYFDSTVALSAIFPQSTRYADASERLKSAGAKAHIINHGIAEVYRTLTGRLHLPPKDAAKLIEGLLGKFKEAPMTRSDYVQTIKAISNKNLSGPIIYDALHAHAARKLGSNKVHTYNEAHFRKVDPDLPVVSENLPNQSP